jgi:nucleotide-binding universal stress UspA family protein
MTETSARRGVVVGVDASDNAARAAAWAAREAADRALPLHLVHALDLTVPTGVTAAAGYAQAAHQAARDLLEPLARELGERYSDLTITIEVSEHGAAEALVALSEHAHLLVTGTRGHGGFAGMLVGSVSLKTAAHARCPAVVVRGDEAETPRNEIVLGVEHHESGSAIEFAFESAAMLGAHLRVVRAWLPAPAYGGYFYEDLPAREQLEHDEVAALIKSARERHPGVEVTTTIVRENAVPALIEGSRGSRLLVVGAHHHHGPLSIGTGYVVRGLLAHSPTPVAIVPIG